MKEINAWWSQVKWRPSDKRSFFWIYNWLWTWWGDSNFDQDDIIVWTTNPINFIEIRLEVCWCSDMCLNSVRRFEKDHFEKNGFKLLVWNKMYLININKNTLTLSHQFSSLAGLGCRTKANCPLVRPGPVGGVPSVGVFLRDPSRRVSEKTTETSILGHKAILLLL